MCARTTCSLYLLYTAAHDVLPVLAVTQLVISYLLHMLCLLPNTCSCRASLHSGRLACPVCVCCIEHGLPICTQSAGVKEHGCEDEEGVAEGRGPEGDKEPGANKHGQCERRHGQGWGAGGMRTSTIRVPSSQC